MDYKIYVYAKTITEHATLEEAVEALELAEMVNGYKAVGVTKEDLYSCDILCFDKSHGPDPFISKDLTKMTHFKDDTSFKFLSIIRTLSWMCYKIVNRNTAIGNYEHLMMILAKPVLVVSQMHRCELLLHFNQLRAELLNANQLYLMGILQDMAVDEFGYRQCSNCGRFMEQGYCYDGGESYYCDESCLSEHFSFDEWAEECEDNEDSYWTTWDCEW